MFEKSDRCCCPLQQSRRKSTLIRKLTGGAAPFSRTSLRASSHLRWYSRTRSLWLLSMVISSFCRCRTRVTCVTMGIADASMLIRICCVIGARKIGRVLLLFQHYDIPLSPVGREQGVVGSFRQAQGGRAPAAAPALQQAQCWPCFPSPGPTTTPVLPPRCESPVPAHTENRSGHNVSI